MAVFKRGNTWWYKVRFANREIRESAKTQLKTIAKQAEQKRRRELEEGYNDVGDRRAERIQSLTKVADEYLADYALRHRSVTFARYAVGHVKRHLGEKLVVDLGDQTVRSYQATASKRAHPRRASMRKWASSCGC